MIDGATSPSIETGAGAGMMGKSIGADGSTTEGLTTLAIEAKRVITDTVFLTHFL